MTTTSNKSSSSHIFKTTKVGGTRIATGRVATYGKQEDTNKDNTRTEGTSDGGLKYHASIAAATIAKREHLRSKLLDLSKKPSSMADHRRPVTSAIQKNRGLTPRRAGKKNNSRAKRRIQFAKTQQKLKSMRPVYRRPSGAYGGELTGIQTNLVKSIKL